MEVASDCSSLVFALDLIEPPCFVEGADWGLDGSWPFLCQRTCRPGSVGVVAAELAVGELACWFVDSYP